MPAKNTLAGDSAVFSLSADGVNVKVGQEKMLVASPSFFSVPLVPGVLKDGHGVVEANEKVGCAGLSSPLASPESVLNEKVGHAEATVGVAGVSSPFASTVSEAVGAAEVKEKVGQEGVVAETPGKLKDGHPAAGFTGEAASVLASVGVASAARTLGTVSEGAVAGSAVFGALRLLPRTILRVAITSAEAAV